MENFSIPALSGVAIVLILILVFLFTKPIAKILKVLFHAAFGFGLLFLINFFFGSDNFHLELDLANCIIAGFGGIPGVIILALYQYFLA